MHDPTRIPPLMAEVEQLWSALPDLTFRELVGLIGEQPDDAALGKTVARLRSLYPVSARECDDCVVHTEEHNIALTSGVAIVRGIGAEPPRPAIWPVSNIVLGTVAGPLILADSEGNHRHFGLITAITPLIDDPIPHSLRRNHIGDSAFIADLVDGTRVFIGRRLIVYRKQRRDSSQESFQWERIPSLEAGSELVVELPNGLQPLALSKVERILRIR